MFLPVVQQADLLEDEPWDTQRRKILHIMNSILAKVLI